MSKDSEPAFPVPDVDGGADYEGMSLRDYFAAKAIQAFLTKPKVTRDLMLYAHAAYEVADAMLEAREK